MRVAVRSTAIVVLLLGVTVAGCRRERVYVVERIEVHGATVEHNPLLGLDREQIEARLRARLERTKPFRVPTRDEKLGDDTRRVRLRVEFPFTRESMKHGRPGVFAEVGAVLELSVEDEHGRRNYEVFGLGQKPVEADAPAELRTERMREALAETLEQLVDGARLQLVAVSKTREALVEDLGAADPRVRESAVAVLADRKDSAVVPALIERLDGDDPLRVRRTIGQLVEIGDERASTALIDLSRGKDLGFQREILFALGALGGEEAEAYLFTVAQGHDQPGIRAVAEQAMEELRSRRSPARAEERQR